MQKPRKEKVLVADATALPPQILDEGGEVNPFWHVLTIAPNESFSGFPMAHAALVYRCHYWGDRRYPCLWDFDGDCPHHGQENSPRLIRQASLPMWDPQRRRIVLATLTKSCLQHTPELLGPLSIAGRELTVARKAGGRNARMFAHFGKGFNAVPEDKIISPQEIWKTQLNIWQVELVCNQIPNQQQPVEEESW